MSFPSRRLLIPPLTLNGLPHRSIRTLLRFLPSHLSQVEDNGGVYFVPAFAGLYAPYWRDDARGVIVGLTAYNNKSHIVRAALEATAFQIREVSLSSFSFLSHLLCR